ncbi:MAG: DUF4422 domain-containing protein [Methanobrevibacter sp.]|jgi:hypothetical protein|nr:DUF4422 domain-containing protein [Candidatus Methanovirga basalitermitum]
MSSEDITIYVICHDLKSAKMAKNDELYTPLFVGADGQDTFEFLGDDTGDNISKRNRYYSELTGLYWMCKNSESKIIGLNHYRRYLSKSKLGGFLDKKDIEDYLKNHDIIVPKLYNNLGCLSNRENFMMAYFPSIPNIHDLTREVILEKSPEYLDAFDDVMKSNFTTHSNIFIGPKDLMNDYVDWIFPLCSDLEDKINSIRGHPKRLMGYLTEVYFQVWIKHLNLKVKEVEPKFIGIKLNLSKFIVKTRTARKIYETLILPYKKDKILKTSKKFIGN